MTLWYLRLLVAQPAGPFQALKQCSRNPLGGTSEPQLAKRGRKWERPKGVVSGLNPENHRVPSFVFKHFFFVCVCVWFWFRYIQDQTNSKHWLFYIVAIVNKCSVTSQNPQKVGERFLFGMLVTFSFQKGCNVFTRPGRFTRSVVPQDAFRVVGKVSELPQETLGAGASPK